MSPRHRQVSIAHDGAAAQVDEGIAALILALWRRGFRTCSSCERNPGTSFAYVGFKTDAEAESFARMARGVAGKYAAVDAVGAELAHVQFATIFRPNADDFANATQASRDAGFSDPELVGVAFPTVAIPDVTVAAPIG